MVRLPRRAVLPAATLGCLQHWLRVSRHAGLLPHGAPIFQVFERDAPPGHRADNMVARRQDAKAIGQIVEPRGAIGVRHQHGSALDQRSVGWLGWDGSAFGSRLGLS